jgi:hypothetical protein
MTMSPRRDKDSGRGTCSMEGKGGASPLLWLRTSTIPYRSGSRSIVDPAENSHVVHVVTLPMAA